MAFTENLSYDVNFVVIILTAYAQSKILSIFIPIQNHPRHTTMPVSFSRESYQFLKTLTHMQRDKFLKFGENHMLGYTECLSKYVSWVAVMSSGLIEFICIAEYWKVK